MNDERYIRQCLFRSIFAKVQPHSLYHAVTDSTHLGLLRHPMNIAIVEKHVLRFLAPLWRICDSDDTDELPPDLRTLRSRVNLVLRYLFPSRVIFSVAEADHTQLNGSL